MKQILGDFGEEILANHKLITMDFFIHSIPPEKRKQTRYLSIAFIADYLATFSPVDEENIHSFEKHLTIKSAATYIANELLENSMKFHHKSLNYPINFGICLFCKDLVFVASNCVSQKALHDLNEFINEITTSDINELYLRQIEKGAEEKSTESKLGFLSIMNDYSAKLGWKIETLNKEREITTVTTMVQLST